MTMLYRTPPQLTRDAALKLIDGSEPRGRIDGLLSLAL
jgi:hypothetical protein